jgi:hypothetical protein
MWNTERTAQYEYDLYDASIYLRQLVLGAFLGSKEFRLQDSRQWFEVSAPGTYTQFGQDVLGTFVELLDKGIITPPPAAALVGLSPMALQVSDLRWEGYISELDNVFYHAKRPATQGFLMGFSHSLKPVNKQTYFPAYAHGGIEQHGHNYFFSTPNGITPLFPHWWRNTGEYRHVIHSDGLQAKLGANAPWISAADAKPALEAALEEARASILFRATGGMAVGYWTQRTPQGGNIRLLLLDPRNVLSDGSALPTNLVFRSDVVVDQLRDVLDGAAYAVGPERVSEGISIPAGAFRILDLQFHYGAKDPSAPSRTDGSAANRPYHARS